MKLLKTLSAFALGIGLAVTAQVQAQAQTTLERIVNDGKIRVAIDLSVPPWSYQDEDLQPVGSEVGAAQLLAESLGVELEIVSTNGANRIPFLLSGRADIIMSALSITDERKETIDFSIPYSGATTFIAAPSSMNIESVEDLHGLRIAVTRGTTNDSDLTAAVPDDVEIVRFEDEATTITAVASNQLDLVAQAQTLIDVINERNPGKQLEPKIILRDFRVGVGIRKEDQDLREYIDGWIAENLSNGKLGEIYQQYQGTALPADILESVQ
ncbi:transporter substrate-binding domain-containing protein [Pelagibacterium sp. H642]|uniref:transporter substrate-binding domain-containing protein n=1 Tax=Pelagibacterium sp. H642 TaxID=1881069 RepID=UPI00281529B8|nr:transporter substrate-binding domain-containing protein [Pelagibacterium sp. H642]WMT91895.1 transporter substrate-binding domain-containing protein [Pelagibacterium sp. H642]